ncbi:MULTISPECIES: glycoside hydrolase family 3 C-terminal domain-containing protein [Enterococcus]|uniref:glycoside hydrolase family 3 C-terminal domain-containing protein n=1 Tax=Enterococcus TaxID=1350 RepID=UPI000813A75B|nr:glycoside hydrolase family 3 C-terminal domain-containing protein [Enterococcus faecium]AWX46995.1 family 3 glycosyl hydrolase [Enterococcus faecium]EGP5068504.1 family 3 glycosyl hydrolase [Enterococcus faecium]EGP5163309.1 family 3 glycosyl hydrolase [Enterococcus faecium]EME8240439.1 glycoside hydrolase family 3 C-terminal domain-containing protein [Enterococcus faecium]MDV4518915.1 glycoside hydrolase family 3 C-terminal domain-containing protein [Enterococcus faecium]
MYDYPYQNPKLTIRQRVEDLLSRMNIAEKVGQVNQHLYGWECYEKNGDKIELTEKLKEHVKWGGGLGALYGLFRSDPWSKTDYKNGIPAKESWKVANLVQEYVLQHSRWKIPVLLVEECPHGHQGLDGISYPTNIGRGNTFNVALLEQSSRLMAKELAAKGVHLALVSTLDLAKDPRWGRTEECFGEDPILSARFSEAVVRGFQGEIISEKVSFLDQTVEEINKKKDQIGVVLKHCIAQGEALGGHNSGTVTIGRREFSDIYGPLLKSTRNAVGVMAAYNDIDGVSCHINRALFEQTLRKEIGYQGIVMADGVALDRLSDVFTDKKTAAAYALAAGIDLSLWDETYTKIAEAIDNQVVDEKLLDQAVRRVLSVKFLLGLFEQPFANDPKEYWDHLMEESEHLNLETAKESITLLKNDGILPLDQQVKNIAVIGPNAHDVYHLLGDYSAPQTEDRLKKTIVQEIKTEFPQSKVSYAQGCEVRNQEDQEEKLLEAVTLAQNSDVIIAVLGGSSARNFDMEFLRNGAVSSKGINMDSGENVDVASLSLGGYQEQLIEQLYQLGKPIITILVQGRPYDLMKIESFTNAIATAWFPGQEGGKAIAQMISGRNNPSGRLSLSYPRNSRQLPVYYYQRAASKQENYYDLSGSPFYPFGHGLSYTTFEYSQMEVKTDIDKVIISIKVKNTGSVSGKTSTLVYVRLIDGAVIQRTKLLKAFRKDELRSQEERLLVFELTSEDFSYMDIDDKRHYAKKAVIMVEQQEKEIKCNWQE